MKSDRKINRPEIIEIIASRNEAESRNHLRNQLSVRNHVEINKKSGNLSEIRKSIMKSCTKYQVVADSSTLVPVRT